MRETRKPATIAALEERLHEAIRTLRALPDRERKWIHAAGARWPDTLREVADVLALALERVQQGKSAFESMRGPRYTPSKEAIDRMDEALDWLRVLDKDQLRILTLRAFGMSWERIGWRFRKSDRTMQRWYRDALETVLLAVRRNGPKKFCPPKPRNPPIYGSRGL